MHDGFICSIKEACMSNGNTSNRNKQQYHVKEKRSKTILQFHPYSPNKKQNKTALQFHPYSTNEKQNKTVSQFSPYAFYLPFQQGHSIDNEDSVDTVEKKTTITFITGVQIRDMQVLSTTSENQKKMERLYKEDCYKFRAAIFMLSCIKKNVNFDFKESSIWHDLLRDVNKRLHSSVRERALFALQMIENETYTLIRLLQPLENIISRKYNTISQAVNDINVESIEQCKTYDAQRLLVRKQEGYRKNDRSKTTRVRMSSVDVQKIKDRIIKNACDTIKFAKQYIQHIDEQASWEEQGIHSGYKIMIEVFIKRLHACQRRYNYFTSLLSNILEKTYTFQKKRAQIINILDYFLIDRVKENEDFLVCYGVSHSLIALCNQRKFYYDFTENVKYTVINVKKKEMLVLRVDNSSRDYMQNEFRTLNIEDDRERMYQIIQRYLPSYDEDKLNKYGVSVDHTVHEAAYVVNDEDYNDYQDEQHVNHDDFISKHMLVEDTSLEKRSMSIMHADDIEDSLLSTALISLGSVQEPARTISSMISFNYKDETVASSSTMMPSAASNTPVVSKVDEMVASSSTMMPSAASNTPVVSKSDETVASSSTMMPSAASNTPVVSKVDEMVASSSTMMSVAVAKTPVVSKVDETVASSSTMMPSAASNTPVVSKSDETVASDYKDDSVLSAALIPLDSMQDPFFSSAYMDINDPWCALSEMMPSAASKTPVVSKVDEMVASDYKDDSVLSATLIPLDSMQDPFFSSAYMDINDPWCAPSEMTPYVSSKFSVVSSSELLLPPSSTMMPSAASNTPTIDVSWARRTSSEEMDSYLKNMM